MGPESTGKSTLTRELAAHYHTNYVPEYAREYISTIQRPYLLDDIVAIAKKQIELEHEQMNKGGRLLLCDTNLLVTKIWAENAFKVCPQFISENWNASDYGLHLLLNIDLPWVDDPQREHPHLREFFFDWYEEELIQTNAMYKIISGTASERFKNAKLAIDLYLESILDML